MEAYLILEDGSKFKGFFFGKEKEVSGEVVFSTGMVGYPEAFTDPSYQGQILVLTYPLIGNYGVPSYQKDQILSSFESKGIKIKGLVVGSNIDTYSHWQAVSSLHEWLEREGIPAIYGIDTRMLTIKLRQKGVMLGVLQGRVPSDTPPVFKNPNSENLVAQVSIKKPRVLGTGKKKILLLDCGIKEGILENLLRRDTTVYQIPWDYDPFSVKQNDGFKFDGVLISNGPGNPKIVTKTIETVKKLLQKRHPILGICLGNQILALAAGADTYKLKYGHRSHNQPVKLLGTNSCFLTTQNHGYAINEKTLPAQWQTWFKNLNDGTNEGIRHKSLPFMAVQFHPEGRPGPQDTNWVFDEFIKHVTQNM